MGELILHLSDPGFGVPERLGVGGIALALDAADVEGHDLAPLHHAVDDRRIRLTWPEEVSDRDALMPLVTWAWQSRGSTAEGGLGVLYLPGVHRGSARDDETQRLVENSGILSTYLQHPRIQPKTKQVAVSVHIDDSRETQYRFVEPKNCLRYVDHAPKLFDRRGRLRTALVEFSSFLFPGATARHGGEPSWSGEPRRALALLFTPTASLYLQIRGKDWAVVMPDVSSLGAFVRVRRAPLWRWKVRDARAGGAADAGLAALAAIRVAAGARLQERLERVPVSCVVMRIGVVAWNTRQSVRNDCVHVRPTTHAVDDFQVVFRNLPNRIVRRKEANDHFVVVPSPRSVIADNLLRDTWWYRDLFEIPRDHRKRIDDVRKRRAKTQPASAHRVWFEELTWLRDELRSIMDELTPRPIDRHFMEAFHLALRNHYGREGEAAKRGARSPRDRMQDFRETVRRDLMRAQTRGLLRAVLAEYFAAGGGNEALREHGPALWRFIDDPHEWRRARDLALLSLATYRGKHREDADIQDESQPETQE